MICATDGVCDLEIKIKNLSESPGGTCMKFTHVGWQQLACSDCVARELRRNATKICVEIRVVTA